MATLLTQEIQIASIRFRHNAEQVKFESYPKRIVYKGRTYVLTEA